MKKKAKEREREGNADPKLVIPAMARIENKAYKPGLYAIILTSSNPFLHTDVFSDDSAADDF